jgi:hypothetical protein
MKLHLLAALLATVLATPAAVAADIWKWRDSTGHITFSDTAPPITVPEKAILSQPGGTPRADLPLSTGTGSALAADQPASAPGEDPALEARKRKVKDEEDAKLDAQKKADAARVAQAKSQNCRMATNQLAALQSGQRMARPTASGERVFLDDKARADEIQRTRTAISDNCN